MSEIAKEKGPKQYAVSITLTSDRKVSLDDIRISHGGHAYVTNRPLAQSGLSREELLDWYNALPSDEQHAVKNETERFVDRQDSFDAQEYAEEHDDCYETIRVVGGNRKFIVTETDEEYETGHDALIALGWTYDRDGSLEEALETEEDNGNLRFESTEDFPPMWNTVWRVSYIPSDFTVQELADFTGFTVYEQDAERDYIIGVNGAGYSFAEAHWIPLAYLYGQLSN